MLAGLTAAAALRPDRAFAAWPERNISMLHGLTVGGGVDVSARVIADGLSKRLGQQIVVELRPGAAGTLAAAQVARAAPDGYTLGWIPSGHAVTAAMYKALPYHPIDDFTIVGTGDRVSLRHRHPSEARDPQRHRPGARRQGERARRCSAACRARARLNIY